MFTPYSLACFVGLKHVSQALPFRGLASIFGLYYHNSLIPSYPFPLTSIDRSGRWFSEAVRVASWVCLWLGHLLIAL